ncbi:N-acetylmuramoyl-L-alanine amidase family protein [Acetonema longum]|uniref:N-acetylmuramoyl-L-alanine amidase n=1 Tax=Acetonema longum DSM 6540 TaxID=1009370 RepID=F7NEB7_9FIRM|nr:N-acetylmuramoyl-L-alanine amidase [Acetonema longum]EGO65629.1 N-acetylmuramoyl-L-alanine amidase [Acetonema longum DSM 6540]
MAKVCIDPGHAGPTTDPGAVSPYTGLREADVALSVSLLVRSYLCAAGHEVCLTRTELEQPETDDLGYRTQFSNDWGADLFVSLHCNSATIPSAHGFEVWTSPGQTQGDVLATRVFEQIQGEFPDRYGRADYSDGDPDKESKFYVLVYTKAPACLIEMAFLSNEEESCLLADAAWQDRMARAVARGITDYFGIVGGDTD